ncbi:MAG: AAA family ATPase [Oceanobacter sp.]
MNNIPDTVLDLMDRLKGESDDYVIPDAVELPPQGSWPKSVHKLTKKQLFALVAAYASGRPLLVTGATGVGKSSLARAAASLFGFHFMSTVIQPFTEYQELLWSTDHTARLAQAQLLAALKIDSGKLLAAEKQKLAVKHFVSPGPLWWALDWESAKKNKPENALYTPEPELEATPATHGLVCLVDEIDKADRSLADGLLEVFGNGGFNVPLLNTAVCSAQPNLVIITSNAERDLPPAFIRRCVQLEITLPEGDALVAHLVDIGQTHFPELEPETLKTAAIKIVEQRNQEQQKNPKTGQAEYIDLLETLAAMPVPIRCQHLEQLAQYFFNHAN